MNTSTLILAVVLGAVGMAYFSYGKIRKRVIPMVGGVVLMMMPYFSASISVNVLAVVLLAVLSYFVAF